MLQQLATATLLLLFTAQSAFANFPILRASAVIRNDQCYIFYHARVAENHEAILFLGSSLAASDRDKIGVYKSKYDFSFMASRYQDGCAKISYFDNRFWLVAQYCNDVLTIPVEELHFLDLSNGGLELGKKKYGRFFCGNHYSLPTLAFLPRPAPAPLSATPNERRLIESAPGYTNFDIIPKNATNLTVFAKSDASEFLSVFTRDLDKPPPFDGPLPVEHLHSIKLPFQDEFFTYEQAGDYYFLTRSGKLYRTEKDKKGVLTMVPVWIDEKRPLLGAIQDTNSKKVYVFGVEFEPKLASNDKPFTKQHNNRFYFALATKPDLLTYKREKLPIEAVKNDISLELYYETYACSKVIYDLSKRERK